MTKNEVVQAIRQLEEVLAVPCPEGMTRQINQSEYAGKLALAALRIVSELYEAEDAVEDFVGDDVRDLLESYGFEVEDDPEYDDDWSDFEDDPFDDADEEDEDE